MNSIEKTNREYWMQIRHPYSCGIELTPYCNMKCVHCYLQDYKVEKLLRFEQVKQMLDILFDAGVLFVYFTGGEILSHPDFLEIYLYAKKKGFVVEILSNLTLLTPEIVEVFKVYPPATISMSLYGASEETYYSVTRTRGNYLRAVNSLQLLYDAGLHFEIKFIGLKKNLDDFAAVKSIAEGFGVKFTYTFEMFPTLNQGDAPIKEMLTADEIVAFEKKDMLSTERWASQSIPAMPANPETLFFCDIARSSFIIDCEGYMEPCNKLRVKRYRILETPFKKIWRDFGKYKVMQAPEDYPCPTCTNRTVCMPCPAENYLANGRYEVPPVHMCKLAQMRMDEFSDAAYAHLRK